MKKIYFTNSKGQKLVGDFYEVSGNSIVIMCHGMTGEKEEAGWFPLTAQVLQKEGFNVLFFDFAGRGESDPNLITLESEADDLHQAITFCLSKGFNNIGIVGFSLGGLISAKAWDERVRCMVWWSPVTAPKDMLNFYFQRKNLMNQVKEVERTGFFEADFKDGRKPIKISKKLFDDWKALDQKSLISKVKCPVLIIHGEKDEILPVSDSKSAVRYLSKESSLEIIKGGMHHPYVQTKDKVPKYTELTLNWFKKHL